ncbi:MAG: hypothetical protein GY861_22675 [bacterium]|nr:hypothetical protein [bacterium]
MRRTKKSIVQKVKDKMGSVEVTLPCMQDSYIYPIDSQVVGSVRRLDVVTENLKDWFVKVSGDVFDAEDFFDIVEEETGEILSDDVRQKIIECLEIKNEVIKIKRLSMLQLVEGDHYPVKLTQIVQKMYESGSAKDMLSASSEDEGGLLSFNQWVACQAAVDPKIYSLRQVTKVLNGISIDPHWIPARDFMELKSVKVNLGEKQNPWKENEVRDLSEFSEILWVEDLQSDADLTTIVNVSFNGPEREEGIPNVVPFSSR